MQNDIILENSRFSLVIGSNATVKSLISKANGEELLLEGQSTAFCSVTQARPFHNEVKLAHPNKRTTYQANRLCIDNDRLIVGFEIIPYEAVLSFVCTDDYIAFKLEDFIVPLEKYAGLKVNLPPVEELRLIQLPIKSRKHFGEWLNASWDDDCVINVLATSPYASIDSERRVGGRIMYADALKEVKLKGTGAAIIVSKTDEFLDCMDRFERDFDLPHGVESRRNPLINASIYWTSSANPKNIDEHIAFAKKGGFKLMLLYYTSFIKEEGGYALNGNYDYNDSFPNGDADLKAMLKHIRESGITPGLHFLQTHIGLKSRYVTPHADHRLHLKQHFTLERELSPTDDGDIFVMENPEGAELSDGARILKFGTELISYEGYIAERPYRFVGCKRGDHATEIISHPTGEIGGVLDVSEFGASSVYLDQSSELQDEIADKIAHFYNLGFGFTYFDGSEGTNPPFAFHVPNAQYRVYKKLKNPPIFAEGAAKAHFGWHITTGGNAFDIFPSEIFKEKLCEFPAEEAPRMKQDFTRLNFGWWQFRADRTQADMYEFGTSRAAAWDCPATVITDLNALRAHARTNDILEVMRRWEDVRARGLLTEEQKLMLRDLDTEHILLINEEKEYELLPYYQVKNVCGGDPAIRAFVFERNGESLAVFWHTTGKGQLSLPCSADKLELRDELYLEPIALETSNGKALLPLENRRYIKAKLSLEELTALLESGRVI